MIYIIIILIILLIVAGWIINNLHNQSKQLQEYLDEAFEQEDRFLTVYDTVLRILVHTKIEMEKIDFRGAFRTDDEVGFTFIALKSCIDTVASEIDKINNDKKED